MKEFIKKTLLFLIIPSVFYLVFNLFLLPKIFEATIGPSVSQQLAHSFSKAKERNYDLVILGNSRMFCGLNPDKFQIPTYNFSHNNDSYNQLYYKLLWLEKNNKKVDEVVLGVDYFQFGIFSDSRNYVYSDYLGKEYDKDYKKRNYTLGYYRDLLRPEKIKTLFKDSEGRHSLKDNGQFVRLGKAKEDEFIKRKFKMNPIQVGYFKKIISYCNQKSIKVFLVMPPLRAAELKSYTTAQLNEFDTFVNSYNNQKNVWYFDFSRDPNYNWDNFIDFTHLNQKAADRFSLQLNDSINKRLMQPKQ